MRANELIGRKVRRVYPGGISGKDDSYMKSTTKIIKVEDGQIYHSPDWTSMVFTLDCAYWFGGWKPVDGCGCDGRGSKKIKLFAGSVDLLTEDSDVAAIVAEIQGFGGFDIISAGDGRVHATRFFGDSDKGIAKIRELVAKGWVWN